jgi:hypothetical protein
MYFLNTAFDKLGIYNENIDLIELNNGQKNIVFFPMSHLGTTKFYEDVNGKIDSLKNKGYFFYYEKSTGNIKEDTILRKIRKIRGVPFSKNGNLEILLDTLLSEKQKKKLKKQLITQPKYDSLGLNVKNSRNVDASMSEIIERYEINYGTIILEECDFNNTIYDKTNCNNSKPNKKQYDAIVIEFRNSIVVDEILNENDHNKIAVIYGKGHLEGIKASLIEEGFKEK